MRQIAQSVAAACLFVTAALASARAGTFQLWEGTTDQMANAYAGQGAKAASATMKIR